MSDKIVGAKYECGYVYNFHFHLIWCTKYRHELFVGELADEMGGASARLFPASHPEIRRDEFWGNHLWTRSYYMSTLGNMSRDVVEQYIADQKGVWNKLCKKLKGN